VLAEVVTVRVEEPDPFTDVGTKDDVAPAGKPVTEKFTVPENPFKALTDTKYAGTFASLHDGLGSVTQRWKSPGPLLRKRQCRQPGQGICVIAGRSSSERGMRSAATPLIFNRRPVLPIKLLLVLPFAALSGWDRLYGVSTSAEPVSTAIRSQNRRLNWMW
jgi:hypothetical protein